MSIYSQQIQRIKEKLLLAKKKDKKLQVFGADSHHYELKKPATNQQVSKFEKKYSIELPECYKAFITELGNGGKSYGDSAAGPFYGIYALGKNIEDLISNDIEKYLKNECLLYPKMTDEYWISLTKNIEENEEMPEEQRNEEIGKLFGGILPIGSQGCTYVQGLVLNGKYKGRVVNLDMDRNKPQFTYENNFLDWYERWLDEVISGELITDEATWFGYNKGGTEEQLLATYANSTDVEEKKDCLYGLFSKKKLKKETIEQAEQLISANPETKGLLTQLVCRYDYEKAKPHLMELAKTDLLPVVQAIYWYARKKSKEWLPVVEKNISKIQDIETFRFCTYVLLDSKENIGNLLIPFTKNDNEQIRATAIYTLGQLKNKKNYLEAFIEGLQDSSNYVIDATLQTLYGVKNRKLLKYYKLLAERFPTEPEHLISNLNDRLEEYGLNNETILKENV